MPRVFFDTDMIWKLCAANLFEVVAERLAPDAGQRWRLAELEQQLGTPRLLKDFDRPIHDAVKSAGQTMHVLGPTLANTQGPVPFDPAGDYEAIIYNELLGEADSLFLTHDKRHVRRVALSAIDHARLDGRVVLLEAILLDVLNAYGPDYARLVTEMVRQAPQLRACADRPSDLRECLERQMAEAVALAAPLRLWMPRPRA